MIFMSREGWWYQDPVTGSVTMVVAGRRPLEEGVEGRGCFFQGEGRVPPAGWGWEGVLPFRGSLWLPCWVGRARVLLVGWGAGKKEGVDGVEKVLF